MDIFEKSYQYSTVKIAKAQGIYPYFIPLDENEGTEVIYEGRHIIMCRMTSNFYHFKAIKDIGMILDG
jgi:hypothetical protein